MKTLRVKHQIPYCIKGRKAESESPRRNNNTDQKEYLVELKRSGQARIKQECSKQDVVSKNGVSKNIVCKNVVSKNVVVSL